VHFKWKDKDFTLKARSLDLTHPYFVSIKDLVLPMGKKLIIDPSDDEVRKNFGKVEHLMIPFQKVSLIEEFQSDPDEESQKVMPFTVVEEKEKKKEKV